MAGGAVAQLGARVNGIHEVAGSIPASSTNFIMYRDQGTWLESRGFPDIQVYPAKTHSHLLSGSLQSRTQGR